MDLSIREASINDIAKVVDYFLDSDEEFMKGMGADKSRFPERDQWISHFNESSTLSYEHKKSLIIIWLYRGEAVGHSSLNKIQFSKEAFMHLHLWNKVQRQLGWGQRFMKMTIPYYFNKFKLNELYCEPFAENPAPNKTLRKLGFRFLKTYKTTPGTINFYQSVNRYVINKNEIERFV